MPKLGDLLRLADPFQEACWLAESPAGLLGKLAPESLRRVGTYIGTPQETWTLAEWKLAAEILAYFADEIERRQREADEAKRRAASPKKRGPKPKKLLPLRGLLHVGRGRGRPRKLPEEKERETLSAFLDLKAELEKRDRKKYTDKAAAELLARDWRKARGERESLAREDAERLRRVVSGWRRKYGAPLKAKKATRKQSGNSG